MKLRVKPGPRTDWGRVDLNSSEGEYIVQGLILRPTKIGRMGRPCLVFPLGNKLRVGDMVEVEPVLRCKICGKQASILINGSCDGCYMYVVCGDMVAPPLAAVPTAAGEGEDDRP